MSVPNLQRFGVGAFVQCIAMRKQLNKITL